MKLKGKIFKEPNVVSEFITRGDSEDFEIRCKAVISYDEFDKLISPPSPPIIKYKDGTTKKDFNSLEYNKQLTDYGEKKSHWHIITSLSATDGLEWEKVDLTKPDTWHLWSQELTDAFFTEQEITRIINAIAKANGVDDKSLKEARDRFLAQQALEENSSSQKEEEKTI